MGIIKILPEEEAHKIAAGEVIERPVHALKELVENSIDADAQAIHIRAREGGKKLISVYDTGSGIAPDDLPLAIARHATSKISRIGDLVSLITHGFRGEALASIATVSRITITSKPAAQDTAYTLSAHSGILTKPMVAAAPNGTTITVEDLFYNVPVRQTFLKSKESELRLLTQALIPYALMHPTREFTFEHEGTMLLQCPAVESLAERYAQVMGSAYAQDLITIEYNNPICTIRGCITSEKKTRRDRTNIIITVNNRAIKSTRLVSALLRGYGQLLEPGSYPSAFIALEVPPESIDVNVHPRKEDILFIDPKAIESHISRAVRTALEKTIHQRGTHTPLAPPYDPYTFSVPSSTQSYRESQLAASYTHPISHIPASYSRVTEESNSPEILTSQKDTDHGTQHSVPNTTAEYSIIGQFATTYILLEAHTGLTIVDQHAAHERILYERLRARRAESASVSLLFPERLPLSPTEVSIVREYREILTECGIEIDDAGPQELIARSTPLMYKGSVRDILASLFATLSEEHTNTRDIRSEISHAVYAMMACKAAVKAGDTLSPQEMRTIIETLYKTENYTTCPHGRPTSWQCSLVDIEKIFKRRS